MTLADRLRQGKPQDYWADREVDFLLEHTRQVLEALKDDLLENEPGAVPGIEGIQKVLGFLPVNMEAVKEIDEERADETD